MAEYGDAKMPETAVPIVNLVQKLDNRISRGHETLADLEKRLVPILKPEQDGPENTVNELREAGPHSTVYDDLERLVDRAAMLEHRMHKLMERLEV